MDIRLGVQAGPRGLCFYCQSSGPPFEGCHTKREGGVCLLFYIVLFFYDCTRQLQKVIADLINVAGTHRDENIALFHILK